MCTKCIFVNFKGALFAQWFCVVSKSEEKTQEDHMPATQFRTWRRSLGLKQKDAADLLGLKKRMIQYYEKGARDGKTVTIPKSVRLACYAISIGISDYDGKTPQKLDLKNLSD
jgi:DNA-binding XRE family transcriptional regulator